ncbi:MAG: hypothetical protein AUK44_02730 [Porphyromonadaceae bacterium CG2_30_38_12]|nr:MAG: hypothetical protein AUK44_02730 [Porphyromonadaceae bacterium CG2_30_38_12]
MNLFNFEISLPIVISKAPFRGLGVIMLCVFATFASAQQLSWSGNVDNTSLFNSANWLDEGTSNPYAGSLASGVAINRNVYFGPNANIGTDKEVKGIFDAGTGSLSFKKTNIRTDYAGVTGFKSATSITLDSAIVLTGYVSSPQITLSGNSQLHLYEADAISADTRINIVGEDAWVYFHSLSAQQVIDKYAKQISIDGVASIPASNCRITQYYDGAVVIPHRSSIKALYLYSGANLTGSNKYFRVSYSTNATGNIGVNGTNKAASFILKKGYMATIIQNQNGTGASKVYVAEDSDIVISGKINGKNDTVNIVRVAPWRWISKKGIGGNFTNFDAGWYYNWGAGSSSTTEKEFVPMQWGTWNADVNVENLKTKPDVTHFLAFNEPDGKDQANMTMDQILNLWPKLMQTGLRLGSPAFVKADSLYKFMDKALAKGYRVDFMCLHSYEKRTGDNYVNTIYKPLWDKYQIPLWITEFAYGAPWNTTSNDKILAYNNGNKNFTLKMDAAPFVERYALFSFGNPVLATDSLFCAHEKFFSIASGSNAKSVLSARGVFYRDLESLPSRGNPLIYRAKISKAKQLASTPPTNTVNFDGHFFSFVSRNTDGTNRRRIQISTTGKVNTGFIGGISTVAAPANEVFLMTKTSDNIYRLKVNYNSLTLSVRNDSVVVEPENQNNNQLWEMVAIAGTSYYALKNVATGSYINPLGNSINAGTLLTMLSSTDITQNKSAYWEPIASLDPTLGVFDMKVEPLSGNAPLTVKLTGAKLTQENKEAFYRWYVFQGTDTLISTFYNQDYTYTNTGTYRIQVRGRDYVSRNTTKDFYITVHAPSGFDRIENSHIAIFPNPVQNELNISGIAEGRQIVIYDAQGRIVLQQLFNGKSIRAEFLPPGFYLLKSNGYMPVKLMKK